MGTVSYFVATSLDGFIADMNDDVSWLFTDADYGYQAFYDAVDVIVMGRKSFDMILSYGAYPYPEKQSYVFSRHPHAVSPVECAEYVFVPPEQFVASLKETIAGTIWLLGGSEIAACLLDAGLIDELVVSVHPYLLGRGVPLFATGITPTALSLVGVASFPSGLVQMTYRWDV